ncbi:hypothetical protein TcBrA4_0131100 [Trypanosoma cruzi]|nr:hypothetical protein TcBrA4_0131100 [Trypanosoma cruzi]
MIPVSVKKLEESVHVKHRIRNAFSLWWLGMINNFHYTLVLAGSDGIAEGYGMKKYVALITFANVFFGIISNFLNAFVIQRLSYNIRVTAASLMTTMAILLVSFAWGIGGHNNVAAFIVMLIGVTFVGVSSNLRQQCVFGLHGADAFVADQLMVIRNGSVWCFCLTHIPWVVVCWHD